MWKIEDYFLSFEKLDILFILEDFKAHLGQKPEDNFQEMYALTVNGDQWYSRRN